MIPCMGTSAVPDVSVQGPPGSEIASIAINAAEHWTFCWGNLQWN